MAHLFLSPSPHLPAVGAQPRQPLSSTAQGADTPLLDIPFCLARLKTLMSLSCTPIPVRRDTDSVALSLLPLLMEPFA